MSNLDENSVDDAREKEFEKLMRMTKVNVKDVTSRALLEVSKNLLEIFGTIEPTQPEQVTMMMLTFMPSRTDLLADSHLLSPTFPIYLLKLTTEFYGIGQMQAATLDALSEEVKSDGTGMLVVWLITRFDPQMDTIMRIYNRFKELSLTPSVSDNSDKTDAPQADPPSTQPTANATQSENEQGHQGTQGGTTIPPQDVQNRHVEQGEGHLDTRNINRQDHRVNGSGRRQPLIDPTPSRQPLGTHDYSTQFNRMSSESDMVKKYSAVNTEFRDKKFSGDLEQPINQTIRDFDNCARQLRLTDEQKRNLFVNIFSGPARDFYFDNTREEMGYRQLVRVMIDEYDSDARRLAVQSELEMLTLHRLMVEKGISDEGVGLSKLVERINVLTPQCPPNFRSESNKIRYLRSAVLDRDWAQTPVSNITTAQYSFNSLVTALREQLQLQAEKKSRNPQVATLYQRYGRAPPKKNTHRHKNPIGRDGKRMLCNGCGSDEHLINSGKCDNAKSFARRQLANGTPAVHVLHDLVQQFDSLNCDDNQHNSDDVNHVAHEESELDAFDSLESTNNEMSEDISNPDAADSSSATNYIRSVMDANDEAHVHCVHQQRMDFRRGRMM